MLAFQQANTLVANFLCTLQLFCVVSVWPIPLPQLVVSCYIHFQVSHSFDFSQDKQTGNLFWRRSPVRRICILFCFMNRFLECLIPQEFIAYYLLL